MITSVLLTPNLLFCVIFFEVVGVLQVAAQNRNLAPTFFLYTRENAQNAERLRWNNTGDIRSSRHFNGSRNTKLIVHGFLDSPTLGRWMGTTKDQFLKADDLNVLIVDWSNANQFPYGQAVANARPVGRMVASMVRALSEGRNSNPSRFHILGHSLGAHVAGFAGKALNGLGQITGLDPAGPGFEGASPRSRLWHSDAQFVDVIHTDAGRLGMWETCGNVDLYPNGGRGGQPGCRQERVTFMSRGFIDGARALVACDHQRAADYYSEAITTRSNTVAYQCDSYNNFRAGRCNSCGQNGNRCVPLGPRAIRARGSGNNGNGRRFFLSTASSSPFFRN